MSPRQRKGVSPAGTPDPTQRPYELVHPAIFRRMSLINQVAPDRVSRSRSSIRFQLPNLTKDKMPKGTCQKGHMPLVGQTISTHQGPVCYAYGRQVTLCSLTFEKLGTCVCARNLISVKTYSGRPQHGKLPDHRASVPSKFAATMWHAARRSAGHPFHLPHVRMSHRKQEPEAPVAQLLHQKSRTHLFLPAWRLALH